MSAWTCRPPNKPREARRTLFAISLARLAEKGYASTLFSQFRGDDVFRDDLRGLPSSLRGLIAAWGRLRYFLTARPEGARRRRLRENIMYLRFVCAQPHPRVAAEAGFFHAYWDLRERLEPELDPAPWTLRAPSRQKRVLRRRWLALYNAASAFRELDSPELRGPERIKRGKRALFWFREDAALPGRSKGTVRISARILAVELQRWGVEIREIRTETPGGVIWEDAQQVLALPGGPVPRAFGGRR